MCSQGHTPYRRAATQSLSRYLTHLLEPVYPRQYSSRTQPKPLHVLILLFPTICTPAPGVWRKSPAAVHQRKQRHTTGPAGAVMLLCLWPHNAHPGNPKVHVYRQRPYAARVEACTRHRPTARAPHATDADVRPAGEALRCPSRPLPPPYLSAALAAK